MLEAIVHEAGIQDRDGAPGLIKRAYGAYPTLTRLFTDGGYARQKLEAAIAHIESLSPEIVKRSDTAKAFVVLSKRWIVERTIRMAWALPPPRKGLGSDYPFFSSMDDRRIHRKNDSSYPKG